MQITIKKIALLLIIIVMLPLIIFSIYEVNSFSENEKILQRIYTEQLNTIIFSVNQYVDDTVQRFRRKIINIVSSSNLRETENKIADYIKQNPSIDVIVFADTSLSNEIRFYAKSGRTSSANAVERIQKLLLKNRNKIKNLFNYKISGYEKVEPLLNDFDETPLLLFVGPGIEGDAQLFLIIINIEEFLKSVVNKKIATLLDEDLFISVFYENSSLSNNILQQQRRESEPIVSKDIWLLPGYKIGIWVEGKTLQDLIEERSTIGFIIIIMLNIIIFAGIGVVFINIRAEIKLFKLKSDFVSNVSHEIRTPLSLISMFAETLELDRVKSEEKKYEYYKIIRRESERLTRIVNKILNFSQLESSKKKFHFESTNLGKLVYKIINDYKFHLTENNVECEVKNNNKLPEIEIDKEAITEVLINLIDNAIKYSDNDNKLIVLIDKNENEIFIEVEDNGIGISKENQKKIFEKFYRVSSGFVHNTKGSGLGLSIVHYIMNAHGGSVSVKSKLGEGSKFRINFPINI